MSPTANIEVFQSAPGRPVEGNPKANRDIEELASRLETSFRDVYLQLISVIQGVAFSFLVSVVYSNISDLNISKWLALATSLVAILVIWQEYMVGATAFAWIPTLMDTVIPFGLGIFEFTLIIVAVGPTRYFVLALAIGYLLGSAAWGNCWFHATRGFPINATSYSLFGRYIRFGVYMMLAGSIILIVLFGLDSTFNNATFDVICAACVLPTILPLLLHSIWHWNLPLRRQLGHGRLG